MSTIAGVRRFLCRWLCPTVGEDMQDRKAQDTAYSSVVLPRELVVETQRLLRSFNTPEGGHEGLVYWAGVASGRGGAVTTLVVPDAESGYGKVQTTPGENAAIIRWLSGQGLVLLGQAHSHPPGAEARHSMGDDEMTFSPFEGQVSVVVADHAKTEDEILDGWGVHRFIDGAFEHVPRDAWDRHFRVVPAQLNRRQPSR